MNKTLKLRLAAESGDVEIVKQLLTEGAQITPDIIFKAVEKKHTSVILELLKSNSEAVRNGIKSACRTLNRDGYHLEIEHCEIIKEQIDDSGIVPIQYTTSTIKNIVEDLFIELSWNMDNETLMNAVFPGVNK